MDAQSSSSAERRKFPRKPIKMWVNFKTFEQGKIFRSQETISMDVSAGGMGIWSIKRMDRGQVLVVNLFLPPKGKRLKSEDLNEALYYSGEEGIWIPVFSQVAWCAPLPLRTEEFRLGVQFVQMDPRGQESFDDFLCDYNLAVSPMHPHS